MLVPMGHIGVEIGLGPFRRAHAAEISGHLGIEMQCDEVREVILTKPLGSQVLGAEMIHGPG